MTMNPCPVRSVLYVPGSNARALEKAKSLAADAIIFDLEDAVSPDQKPDARTNVLAALKGRYGARMALVRVNGLETEWGNADHRAFVTADIDGILIPKVDNADDVQASVGLCPGLPIWAMLETAQGVLNAQAIAAHPQMAGLVLGTNDLAKDLGARHRADRAPLQAALQMCLLAARAAGIVCVDGVFNAFRDSDGLLSECEQGRDMGFDGKTLIHPAQIDVANDVFGPSEADVEIAHRQIAAFEQAQAQGKAIAVVDGRIVEALHIEAAHTTLKKVKAIAALGT